MVTYQLVLVFFCILEADYGKFSCFFCIVEADYGNLSCFFCIVEEGLW